MADDRSEMAFEDIPLEEARRMGRGPRMEPLLYDTLRQKLQALSTEATRIRLLMVSVLTPPHQSPLREIIPQMACR
jgi:hypothetical protein